MEKQFNDKKTPPDYQHEDFCCGSRIETLVSQSEQL